MTTPERLPSGAFSPLLPPSTPPLALHPTIPPLRHRQSTGCSPRFLLSLLRSPSPSTRCTAAPTAPAHASTVPTMRVTATAVRLLRHQTDSRPHLQDVAAAHRAISRSPCSRIAPRCVTAHFPQLRACRRSWDAGRLPLSPASVIRHGHPPSTQNGPSVYHSSASRRPRRGARFKGEDQLKKSMSISSPCDWPVRTSLHCTYLLL
ncbi:hypothetical protein ZWY2020_008050 [Hordeum vulgare]|nr:hypothetical protein ZWY2020_008050 [Hordeum vulgare]